MEPWWKYHTSEWSYFSRATPDDTTESVKQATKDYVLLTPYSPTSIQAEWGEIHAMQSHAGEHLVAEK